MATPPVFTAGQVLTAAQMNAISCWLVKSATFSATSDLILDDIFTTDYTNYKIILEVDTISTNNVINFQFRDGTTSLNTSYYSAGFSVTVASALTKVSTNNGSQETATVGYDALDYAFSEIQVYRPKDTAYTMYSVSSGNYRPTELFETVQKNGAYQQTTPLEGIRFFTGTAATFAGKYFVYGYR